MGLKLQASDGVKVYNITATKIQPDWIKDSKKKRELRKDPDWQRRIDLLQDFDFPAACQRIKVSPDEEYIFATGYHPPMIKVFELSQLAMKCDRHLDSEIVDFQILSSDYSKAVFLRQDRGVHFHARGGNYHLLRVPKAPRDLAYAPFLADLLICGSAPEIYRISLSEGRFLTPLPSASPAVNACGISPVHGMFAAAGEDGNLECFDLRADRAIGTIAAAAAAFSGGQQLTAVRFDDSGLLLAAGTSDGKVAVFDLRSSQPLRVKDHMYDSPIVDIKFHTPPLSQGLRSSTKVVSSDTHICKIWELQSGKAFTSIEPAEDINDLCIWPGSGLILAACESPRIQAFFVPALGPAPPWCSYLESLTEELEETAASQIYDDYRFVTGAEVEQLGLGHLVGTSLLRAYMHGFFMDHRLYKKAHAVANPFAYEEYRQQRIAKKLEEQRATRISVVRKAPKVNATYAARLLEQDKKQRKKRKTTPEAGEAGAAPGIMEDERFKALFQDEDFAVDEASDTWKLLHPNAPTDKSTDRALLREHFAAVESDDDANGEDQSQDSLASDDERESAEDGMPDDSDDDSDEAATNTRSAPQHGKKKIEEAADRRRAPKMYAARTSQSTKAFQGQESFAAFQETPLGARVAAAAAAAPRVGVGLGSKELVVSGKDAGRRSRGSGRDDSRGPGRVTQRAGAASRRGAYGRGRGRGGGRGRGRGRGR